MLCTVYKSRRKEAMYLYVGQVEGLKAVPQELLDLFGEPREVLSFALTPDRKLAQASAPEVIKAIKQEGFFLQLPPNEREPGV